jgi:microcystin degradation protein MlrC
MSLKIAIGGICHETNQFVSSSTPLEQFDVDVGPAVLSGRMTDARMVMGGLIARTRALGAEPVGTLYALAEPSGPIQARAYATLKQQLLTELEAALPVDAVALELHGAGAVEGLDDLEGDLCQAVRRLIGPDVILSVGHDLHSHITETEVDAVDALTSMHAYPHDDMYECGERVIDEIARLLSTHSRPAIHVERLPMLIPMTTTYRGVGADVLRLCESAQERAGVIEAVFVHGFPYADSQHVGCQIMVTTDDDAGLAASVARDLASAVWERRDEFLVDYPDPRAAVQEALRRNGRPIVINETSDNPGTGGPGDATHLLAALLDARPADAVFCGIVDPDAVRSAHAAGVGATIDLSLGAKGGELYGTPIECRGYVRALTDGETVIEAPTGRGWRHPLGPTVLLMVQGIEIIVISRTVQTYDRTPLILHGIDPLQRKLIALKSSQHFRSGFESLADAIITTDAPGITTAKIDTFPRSRCPRPMFPLDSDARYNEERPPRTVARG